MNRTLSSALACLALVTVSAAPSLAQRADAIFSGFEPTGSMALSIDGKPVPKAEIYDHQRVSALLVRSSELPSPLMVDLQTQEVSSIHLMKFSVRTDGRVDLLADAVFEPLGRFEFTDGGARFTIGGKRLVLAQAPNVLGPQSGAALLESSFGYRWRAKSYEPDAATLGRLRGEKRDVTVLTFFGTWCPHCARNMPSLLKIEQRLADARIRFSYHGLPPQGLSDVPEAAKYDVDSVPTAIVLVAGKEVGRIPAAQWAAPETAIDLILHPERAKG